MTSARTVPSLVVTAWLAPGLLLSSSAPVLAQRAAFIDALSSLTTALAGTYGDEGPQASAALARMAAALAEWDRSIAAMETRAAPGGGARGSTSAAVRHALAEAYLQRGRFADTLREIDMAARLEPSRADLHRLRGAALDAMGRPEEASTAFRIASRLDPDDPIAAYYAARAGQASDPDADRDEALATLMNAYRRLLRGGSHAPAARFAPAGLLPGRDSDAPLVPQAAHAGAYASILRGEYDTAVAAFADALATDPLLADPAARSGTLRKAVAELRRGRHAEARSLAEAALQDAPQSSEVHRVLGLVHRVRGDEAAAIAHFEASIRLNPLNERARLALVRVLLDAGRQADAERALRETLAVLPDSGLSHWWLASLYEGVNRMGDARQHFEQAARSTLSGGAALHASAGRLASIEGDFAGAVAAFERLVRAHPNDAAGRQQLARAYVNQDLVGHALAELLIAALVDPSAAPAHAFLGQLHLDAGRLDDAVAALQRALDLEPGMSDARYALATALARSGRSAEAAAELEIFERAQQQSLQERRRSMAEQVREEEAAFERGGAPER